MHSYKCNLFCATLSMSDLEQAEICEKYNDPKTKELIKKAVMSNSHVGNAVSHTLKNKGASKGSSQRCNRRTIFGSTKNHSVKGSLNNHLCFTFLYFEEPSFTTKNLLWNRKVPSDVKGSLWNHLDKKVLICYREAPLYIYIYMP